jgi:hypothetical protein
MTNSNDRGARDEAAQAEDTYRVLVTDELLSLLVQACDDGGFTTSLTVQSGGFLVGGLLISQSAYLRGQAELIRAAGDDADEGREAFAAAFDDLAEQQEQRSARRVARLQDGSALSEPEDEIRPAYLHLRDARLVGPGSRTATPFWRGRLDHIDAFWFGSLASGTPGE